jgi:prepilin-type N-terminal cleavage/methylation domain-containing protein
VRAEELIEETGMTTPRRAAFTLLEMMIAIALSLVVVYTAFAGLRVASQTMTLCNRLSVENGLMRVGFIAALEDLDHWSSYDSPGDTTQQPLRAMGMPFAPLAYDPDFRMSEPKTWWRNFGYSSNSKRWGKYDNFSRVGHPDVVDAWLPEQIAAINGSLGHYAMVDYLPGGSIYSFYTADGLVPDEFVKIDTTAGMVPSARAFTSLRPSGTAQDTPRDIWKLTHNTAYCITTSQFYRDRGYNRFRFHQGAGSPWGYSNMQRDARELKPLLEQRPENWPTLTTDMRRYLVWSHDMDVCQVQLTSPLTGESIRFSFWGIGTTLRGARQQRGLDSWRNGLIR